MRHPGPRFLARPLRRLRLRPDRRLLLQGPRFLPLLRRPPHGRHRLARLADGRLSYLLRHQWRDGTTQILFDPLQLLERLVPLIPAPGAHQVRYHGVVAPCAGWRHRVVPARPRLPKPAPDAKDSHRSHRYPWADLLRRVFAVDALECPDCGGRMRILAAIHPPDATRAILECLGLPSRAPSHPCPSRA